MLADLYLFGLIAAWPVLALRLAPALNSLKTDLDCQVDLEGDHVALQIARGLVRVRVQTPGSRSYLA